MRPIIVTVSCSGCGYYPINIEVESDGEWTTHCPNCGTAASVQISKK